jgi:ABC-2 type transport system ATP-binding protein
LELDDARYRKVEDYSLGMKQRAKLAQALVHDPPVLLLDEPTSGLDPSGRDTMLRLIRDLGTDHGKSIILSTHLLADVQTVCERVVIVAGGTVKQQGTVAELCNIRHGRYRIRVDGPGENFKAALGQAGVTVLEDMTTVEWRVQTPEHWSNLNFFELAQRHGVAIRALVRDDETLEELFLRTIA